ncbi:nucleotidyltransferase domain-containing protein [Ekhidna sp.]
MTNTHIKGHSDIDLLTITSKFYSYARRRVEEIINSPTERNKFNEGHVRKLINESQGSDYLGNSLQDLRSLRIDSEEVLKGVYDICDVTHPKSIKITNKNLNRDVDVVVANWYDDVKSIIYGKGNYRGIQIYNKDKHEKGDPDYPFLSISRINHRGTETNGRLKKMIRFLKNVKADSEIEIDLSSFDINAICYNINPNDYRNLSFFELVFVLSRELHKISSDSSYSDEVVSVDGREYIFRYNQPKLNNLRKLLNEVDALNLDLKAVPIYG